MDETAEPQDRPSASALVRTLGNVRLTASGAGLGGSVNQFGVVGGDVTVFNLPAVQPVSPGPPHQVPAADPCFHNRSEQLDTIDDVVLTRSPDSVSTIILTGLPGIGRTALALAWVHRTLPRALFPGGEVFVDFDTLRDRAGGDTAAALAECLRAFGVPRELIGTSLSELANQYRTVTSAMAELLVVLENVTEPAQVRALLPNRPGSVVVVVGERELGELVVHDGATPVRLGPLDPDTALEVLACAAGRDRTSADPAATARLLEVCAGLPLAVRIAAGQLRLDPHLSVAECVADLEGEADRLEGFALGEESALSLLLDRSYQRLSPTAAALYRTLGLLPVRTFTAQLVQVAAGLPRRAAGVTLKAIQEGSLLSRDDDGRYRLHDLIRLHARALADEQAGGGGAGGGGAGDGETGGGEARRVLGSVVSYFLPLAGFADRAVTGDRTRTYDVNALVAGLQDPFAQPEQGPGAVVGAVVGVVVGVGVVENPRSRALAWLDAERANLMALLRAMVRDGAFDAEAGILAEALTALFLNRRYLTDWSESGTLGADAAARIGAEDTEARLRSLVSRPLSDLGDQDRAGRELERALQVVEGSESVVLRASVWEFRGRYLDLADPAAAAEAYSRSLDLNLEIGSLRGAALATFFLGENQERLADLERALDTFDRARAMFEELTPPDVRMIARVDLARGRAEAALGRTDEAVADLRAAVRALAEVGAEYYEAGARELLGTLAAARGDRQDAEENLSRALAIYESAGDPRAVKLQSLLDDVRPAGDGQD